MAVVGTNLTCGVPEQTPDPDAEGPSSARRLDSEFVRKRKAKAKFIIAVVGLLAVVLTNAFSADLLNVLVLPAYSERVDTAEGVERKVSRGELIIEDLGVYRNKNTIEEAKSALNEDLSKTNKIVFEVLKERYVASATFVDFLDPNQIATYRHIKENIPGKHIHVGVVFRKNYPRQAEISEAFQWMLETGMYQYSLSQHREIKLGQILRMSINEDTPSYDEPVPLRVEHIRPILYILLIGLVASLAILVVELIVARFKVSAAKVQDIEKGSEMKSAVVWARGRQRVRSFDESMPPQRSRGERGCRSAKF